MKKRILSIVLCLVMVLGMLPSTVLADYEDGAECANCGHWHYDDWMCECGLCSEKCSNSDCWYETHCKNCGACYMSADNWCDSCGWCQDCMDNEAHCADCGRCFVGESKEELCEECLRCADCVDNGVCDYCNKCDACADTDHCVECHAHVLSGCCVKCGKCYECADGFICDTCEHCESCAEEEGLHCEFCGGCLEDIDPCPAHEFDSHCKYCVDYCEGCGDCSYDGDIDGLCADCGFCYECCAETSVEEGCSTGEVCVESSDWDEHLCPGCGECFCEKERCDNCGFCEECCAENSMDEGCSTGEVCKESSEWDEHFCPDCGGCFCDYEQCSDCGLCADCCAANAFEKGCDCGDVCVDSTEWEDHKKEYHGEGGVSEEHTHKFKTEWNADQTRHWHECRFCNEKSGEAEHRLTAAGKCEICGYDTSSPLFFVSQPSSLTRKVTDGNAELDDPNGPLKNRAVFSVSAVNLDSEELAYQWYKVASGKGAEALKDEDDYVSGSTNYRLDIAVPSEGCGNEYEYYCVVTSEDADGKPISIESNHAKLRIVHNYGELEATYPGAFWPMINYSYTDEAGKYHGGESTSTGSKEHNSFCFGCDHTKFKEGSRHSFEYDRYLGYGHLKSDPEGSPTKYFYITKCSECGYENLLYTEDKTGMIYNITIIGPDGAYAMNDDDVEGVTQAKVGEHITLIAPYVDGNGYVFDHWEVVGNAPDGFTNASIENYFGVGSFNMPAGNVAFRGIYSTDKVPVKEVQVQGVSHPIDDKGYITVEVGKTFRVKANVLPDNAADKRVYWFADHLNKEDVAIRLNKEDSYHDSGTVSKDTEEPVTLTAVKPGTVMLRAISTESKYTSTIPIQDSVIIKVLPAETTPQTHNYKETTVFATCIKKGYTLHECTDEGCTEKYLSDLLDPTGHNDSDGDGLCNNVDQNTGKVCGYKMGGENTSMVGLTKIKKVELTVDAPGCGGVPASTATPTGDEKDCFNVAQVSWNPLVTNTFADNTKYTVLIKLEAQDDYGFKLDGIEVANTQFYINGNKATVVSKGAQEASITYEFPATAYAGTTYAVKILDSKNGTVSANSQYAHAGTTVKLNAVPDQGFELDTLTALDQDGKALALTEKDGSFTFLMPTSAVTVKAAFKAETVKPGNPFTDVPSGAYYEEAVIWAVDKGITNGTGDNTFDPNGICTRAQAVTFLWRAAGKPAPKSTVMPFADVAAGSYYYDAVLWAVENGITKGTSDTTFSPDMNCTRAQIVTLLWRSQQAPAAGTENPFTDVPAAAYYTDAVLWAVKNGITKGTGEAAFSPDMDCTRAQIVTLIYRTLA